MFLMQGRRKSYYRRKMYFSRQDRILQHLVEYVGYEGQLERPDDLTQFGIAAATGLGRSTISKSMNLLIERGMITAKRAHVPSGKLRRTTYLLTDLGVRMARARKEEIEKELVAVREENGTVRKMPLKEVARQLPFSVGTLELAVHVKQGVFDTPSFLKSRARKPAFVDFTERTPKLRYFFGRDEELKNLDEWLKSRGSRFLVVVGIPGIGKTTLLVKRLEDWRQRTNLFWYRMLEWSSRRNLLRRLSLFLDQLGRRELSNYLSVGDGVDLEEVSRLLEKDLDGLDALFIFDDCHKASAEVKEFLYSLKLILDGLAGPKVIVAGRSVPGFYDRRDAKVNGLVKEIEIQGLDKESSAKLLAMRNVDVKQSTLDSIYDATRGHPLFLELVDPAEGTKTKDILRYFDEDLVSRLSREELSILEVASVFRYPVAPEGFLCERESDMGHVEFLIEQNLLRETSLTMFEIHDLLKDFFRERLTPSRRKRCETWAAQYHASIGTEEDFLEAIYHLFEAGDEMEASELLAARGRAIAKKGHTAELDSLLQRAEKVKTSTVTMAVLFQLRGEVLSSLGEWERALKVFRHSSDLAKAGNDQEKRAAALKAMGDIYVRRNEWDGAIDVLKESLSIYKDLGDDKGCSAVHFATGLLYENFGHVDKALKHFRRASRLVDPKDDPEGLVQYLFAYSRVLGARGELEKSLKLKKEALRVAERTGNLHEIARITVALGVGYMFSNRLDEALEKYRDGISLARRVGNMRVLGYGLMNAASALLRKRNATVAEANLVEAARIFEKLGEKVPMGLCEVDMGFVEEMRDHWEKAKTHLKTGLKILREDHSPLDLLNSSLAAAGLHAKHGELKEASQLLSASKSLAKHLDRDDLIRFVDEQTTAIKGRRKPSFLGVPTPG